MGSIPESTHIATAISKLSKLKPPRSVVRLSIKTPPTPLIEMSLY